MSLVSRAWSLSKIIERRFNFRAFHEAKRVLSGSSILYQQSKIDMQKSLSGHSPTEKEKRLLVNAKMYASVDEVPKTVSPTQIMKAKDYYRIQMATLMLIATVIGCVTIIILGKRTQRLIRLDHEKEMKGNSSET